LNNRVSTSVVKYCHQKRVFSQADQLQDRHSQKVSGRELLLSRIGNTRIFLEKIRDDLFLNGKILMPKDFV